MSIKVKAEGLRLGDTVKHSHVVEPWTTAIVKQITDTDVTLFRPYGVSADFSYTGGVICYVGIEEFTVSKSSEYEYEVFSRKELR